jgi:hypothetical protein
MERRLLTLSGPNIHLQILVRHEGNLSDSDGTECMAAR